MKNKLMPDLLVETVFDIDLALLKKNGIRAFIFDIDNTLATYAMPVPDEKTAQWLKGLADMGFGVYLVSNNNRERVRIFAEAVGVPYIGRALKPLKFYLKRACRRLGISPQNTALVGDQLFTDVWGGNRMKMYTVLVKPLSTAEDSFVKFKRGFERRLLKSMKAEVTHK